MRAWVLRIAFGAYQFLEGKVKIVDVSFEISPPIFISLGKSLLGVGQHFRFQMGVGGMHLEERFAQAQLVQGHGHDGAALFPYPHLLHRPLVEPRVCVGVLPDGLKPVAVAVIGQI